MTQFVISAILIAIGVIAAIIGLIGVYRFKFVMNRMHCAAIIDTLAMSCIIAGLMVATGNAQYIPKLIAILLVLCISSPLTSHIVGKMEVDSDDSVYSHLQIHEEKEENSDGNS
ncbi:MAG: monovalent cation/H(+) antiporter subunit G [Clostridia bacterium]|nr:monovalent cation/H(+) antiporter subunit G [Clostridia bacterium]